MAKSTRAPARRGGHGGRGSQPRGGAATNRSSASSRTASQRRSPQRPSSDRTESSGKPGRGREDAPGLVDARRRFRSPFRRAPWMRRRRRLIAGILAAVLLLIAAAAVLIWLPALRLQQITVEGLGYVEEEAIQEALAEHRGDSVLLVPTGTMADQVTSVPGIATAEVSRRLPDEVVVTVTERTAAAKLVEADGTTTVIDAEGVALPRVAGEGSSLVPLAVESGATDPEGAAEAMTQVLATLPEDLLGAVTAVSASTRSDVTLTVALEDGSSKSVVWGDSRDAELKGEVVAALLGQPGSVIDVSSPVAPVTR